MSIRTKKHYTTREPQRKGGEPNRPAFVFRQKGVRNEASVRITRPDNSTLRPPRWLRRKLQWSVAEQISGGSRPRHICPECRWHNPHPQ